MKDVKLISHLFVSDWHFLFLIMGYVLLPELFGGHSEIKQVKATPMRSDMVPINCLHRRPLLQWWVNTELFLIKTKEILPIASSTMINSYIGGHQTFKQFFHKFEYKAFLCFKAFYNITVKLYYSNPSCIWTCYIRIPSLNTVMLIEKNWLTQIIAMHCFPSV